MGNHINVEWASARNRRGQLDVELVKPRSGRDPIHLNVKDLGRGAFACGHFELDASRSHPTYIFWVDYRNSSRTSVWVRPDSESKWSGYGNGSGNWGGWRDWGEKDKWDDKDKAWGMEPRLDSGLSPRQEQPPPGRRSASRPSRRSGSRSSRGRSVGGTEEARPWRPPSGPPELTPVPAEAEAFYERKPEEAGANAGPPPNAWLWYPPPGAWPGPPWVAQPPWMVPGFPFPHGPWGPAPPVPCATREDQAPGDGERGAGESPGRRGSPPPRKKRRRRSPRPDQEECQ